jgi:hypothetical protein
LLYLLKLNPIFAGANPACTQCNRATYDATNSAEILDLNMATLESIGLPFSDLYPLMIYLF